MNYKETLFFVGKCLTIYHEKSNRKEIETLLKSNKINWDNVVKLSTKHYVFPALYCNFKKVNFLQYLPNDLVDYMQHITDLNRERNCQIIEQAHEINQLLLSNNITPIFLKGTGNLLEGLYEDIAERMVGDIDFIVSINEYQKTIDILTNYNYKKVHQTKNDYPSFKHFPRLQKENKVAAIEIHKELLIEKYASEFNYDFVKKDLITVSETSFLSFENQLSLSIIAKQINDAGQHYKTIALRNSYDVFLLSQKANSLNAILKFNKLFKQLNNYLAITKLCLSSEFIIYKKTTESENYLNRFIGLLENTSISKKLHKRTARKIFIKARVNILIKALFNKKTRKWLYKRIIKGREKL